MRAYKAASGLDSNSHIAIAGAGHAGIQLALNLRELGFDGRVSLFNGEPDDPYDRPTLSKGFLSATDKQPLPLRPGAFYADSAIEIHPAAVVDVDTVHRIVVASDGTSANYSHLVLATGGTPQRLRVPGADLAGVASLRSLSDATQLRRGLAECERVVVVGGGFIGLEVAAAARALGRLVTVVEASDRLMARSVSPLVSEAASSYHRELGSELVFGRMVTALHGSSGSVETAVLDDGTELAADLVVLGVGMVPADDVAKRAGLTTEGGVVVDERLRSSDPHVSAIGDCAVVEHDDSGHRRRLESIPSAHAQARRLAQRLLGLEETPVPVCSFWSHQGSLKLQIAGLREESDHFVAVRDTQRLSVLGFRNRQLAWVESCNDPGGHVAARRLLDLPRAVTMDLSESYGHDLRKLARALQESVSLQA